MFELKKTKVDNFVAKISAPLQNVLGRNVPERTSELYFDNIVLLKIGNRSQYLAETHRTILLGCRALELLTL